VSDYFKVLGIYREQKYSNRAFEADKLIMDKVLSSLIYYLGIGVSVTTIRPEDIAFKVLDFNYDLVLSMGQDSNLLAYLDLLESRGAIVLNSSQAVRNCFRGKLSELLLDPIFSYPKFISLKVDKTPFDLKESQFGFWVKRGDFHAIHDHDVVHINSIEELTAVLQSFYDRGVDDVILQEGVEGELFKFYGVKDQFLDLRYLGRTSKDRYFNPPGNPSVYFDRIHLEKMVNKAADVLGLDFFGGDFIVSDDEKIHLIDFNDWPSFRTCRNKVAPIMAMYALSKLKNEVESDYSFIQ
jgi:hypothetical protein